MKPLIPSVALLGLMMLSAFGQAEVIVRERAKGVANQNNARQGAPPAAPAPAPPAPHPAPAGAPPANRVSVQQQNLARLKATLARVHQEGRATEKLTQEFATNLLAAAQGSGKPTPATLARLSTDLLTALAPKNVSPAVDQKLVSNLAILLNSGGLASSRTREIASDTQAALQSAGVPAADAAKIALQLQTVAEDVERTRHR